MPRLVAIVLLATLWASLATATVKPPHRINRLGTRLAATTLSGAASTLTFSLPLEDKGTLGYEIAVVSLAHVNTSGALTITMVCYHDPDAGGATDSVIQSCTTVSGTCTSDDATWSKAVTGAKQWPWRVDVTGLHGQVNCVLAAAGAAAGDTIAATAALVAK